VLTNFLFSTLSSGSNFFFLLLTIVAARFLGSEDFGKFSFALALVTVFSPLTGQNMNILSTIAVARDATQVNHYFGNFLTIQGMLSVLTTVAIWVTTRVMGLPVEMQIAVILMAAAMIFRSMKLSIRMVFKALDRFELEAYSQFAGQLVTAAACTIVLFAGYRLHAFIVTFAILRLLDFIFTFALVRFRLAPLWFQFDFSVWPRLLKTGSIMALSGVMAGAAFRVDSIFLGLMRSDVEVGWYSAPYRLFETLLELPNLLTITLLPALASAHITSRSQVIKYCRMGSRYLLLVACPVAIFTNLFATEIVSTFYGNEYFPSSRALQILIAALPFLFISRLATTVAMAIDCPQAVLVWTAVRLGLNIILNLLLIPGMGINGAALSTLLTEFIAFLMGATFLFSRQYSFPVARVISRIGAASVLFALLVWTVRSWPLPLALAAGGAAYLATLTFLNFWEEEELFFFRRELLERVWSRSLV
jgi:O-antigen/teichoic acid export membrane protein